VPLAEDDLDRGVRAMKVAEHREYPPVDRRINDPDPPRDELVIKVLVALQVTEIDVHEILQVHRRHAIEAMQRYTQVKAAAAVDDVPIALVADAQLFRLEGIVRWLDAADVRLKQLPAAPSSVAEQSVRPTSEVEVSR
jgi:virulence activator alpha